MVESIEYGKEDERTDDLTTINTGKEVTSDSGTDVNAVWGFNSGNAVNSDSISHGLSKTHTIDGTTPLKEEVDGTVTHVLSGTDTKTNTGKYSDNKTGYDEFSKSGKIKDAGTDTGVLTTNNTGTQTNIGSDSTTGTNSRALDSTVTKSDADHRARSGRHSGNIGNLTSQQMLKEEIELWKWNFLDTVFSQLDSLITCPLYYY